MEGIEYHEDRKLDKAQILRFATCKYIDEGHHIILKGASGNGKTYIACALGNAACRRFKKVQYIRMPELLDELCIRRSKRAAKPRMMVHRHRVNGAAVPDVWCTAAVGMVHTAAARFHYSGIPLRLRMDSPSIWMV